MHIPHIESEPESPYTDVTGVILAGGRSSRMGRDKARLEIGGLSFFEKVAAVFRSIFPRVLIAGDRPDLAGPDLPYLPDRYPGSALGGLYTGLAEAGTPYVFVAPCDLPFPSPELIRAILDRRSGFDVVVPRTPAGLEPLFAVYGRNCLGPMREMLERKEYRVYDFFPRVRVCELAGCDLPAGWERSLRNVNTPEEYRRVKEES
jgi:molybdopterin-guanine dinucleotide biosynthesis protein A